MWPTNKRIITIAEIFPYTPHWANSGILLQEHELPEYLVLEAKGPYIWLQKTDFSGKGHAKKSHTLSPSPEEGSWKESRLDPIADLREPPREGRCNWNSPADTDTGGSHFGELVIQWRHWCRQAYFLHSLLLAFLELRVNLLVLRAYCVTRGSHQSLLKVGLRSQVHHSPTPPTTTPAEVSPATTKGPM